MKVETFSGDSVKNGYCMTYNEKGWMIDSSCFVNGELHGKRYQYYWDNSPYIFSKYFHNREIDQIVFKENDLPFGDTFRLDYYCAFSYQHDLKFFIRYDENQKIADWDGYIITGWTMKPKYKINDSIPLEFLIALPINCISSLSFFYKKRDNNLTFIKKLIPNTLNRVNIWFLQNPNDDVNLVLIGELRDTIRQFNLRDTVFINIDKNGNSSYQRIKNSVRF